MKRPFWVAKTITVLIAAALALCLCGCRTTAGTDHDQIVRSSIDLADSYISLNRLEDALDVYDRAIAEADDYRLYYNKAIVLSDLGRNLEAAELCSSSFENYPHIIAFKKAQALFYRLAGEKALSKETYLQALELNPYDRQTRIQLIDNLIEDGDLEEAYEQALLMWDQGYRDEKSIGYLYQLKPDTWKNLYELIVAEKAD